MLFHAAPSAFEWSSYGANALGRIDSLTTPRQEYLALGKSAGEREVAYRQLFESALSTEDLDELRRHVRHERPLGSAEFTNLVQSATGVCAAICPAGRPRRAANAGAHQENLL